MNVKASGGESMLLEICSGVWRETLLPPPSQETAGFSDTAQRLRHNFGRPTGASPSQPTESALHILKWNAGGLSPKVHELRQQLQLKKIDICLIQETKLISKDPTSVFPGFSTTRHDRLSSHRGGGLLILVNEGIVYQRIAEDYQPPLEKQCIQIQLWRWRWATNHNLYAALTRDPGTFALATT